jgi:pimeloyl-ACP methyl ester carboxylesterase
MMTRHAQPTSQTVTWSWDGADVSCAITRYGTGPSALLLPALSSISSREEMWPLQKHLADHFETVVPDWPGFGNRGKPVLDWTPNTMTAWLDHLLRTVVSRPALVIASGHAAGFVVRHFAAKPDEAPDVVLVAPTWRGPLPTMIGRRPVWLGHVRAAVDNKVVGPLLYALNLNRFVISRMAKGHVYSDPASLTSARLRNMRHVARAKGARFASVRFVTGALDPYLSGDAFRADAETIPSDRLRLIWGDETPRKSKAEMVRLAETTGITPNVLARGKLAVHEEFAPDVAGIILNAQVTCG